ncbi:hypothetical protein NO932_06570 [Pelagibacterium sp. 26DY04]|nr:hypothetical protein [Pelagibacterium sp. 26DY04]WMT88269.1 hypothetical protein NO932_06570 [Pelagibacterium sp. 26DY04]
MLALALAIHLLAMPQSAVLPEPAPTIIAPGEPMNNRKARRRAAKLDRA